MNNFIKQAILFYSPDDATGIIAQEACKMMYAALFAMEAEREEIINTLRRVGFTEKQINMSIEELKKMF